ncbi:FliM/FliN family flagellar motor switch protein [Undibacterium sp. TJN25]|uniref:FliM/FliN family flagellar motor switch protein n=1 Tax=Undibacterium sp. TJN25 TaxID=3413056 RepID=UPI003BF41292
MNVSPFALLSSSVLEAVAQKVAAVVKSWAVSWGVDTLQVDTSCERVWESNAQRIAEWPLQYRMGAQAIWISHAADLGKYLQRQMFPTDTRHGPMTGLQSVIAVEAGQAALEALGKRMAIEAGISSAMHQSEENSAPGPGEFRYGCGGVLIHVRLGDLSISVLLNHACVDAVGDKMPVAKDVSARGDLMEALGKVPVTLSVSAGQVEIDITQLMTLGIGDVICLPSSVDRPIEILGPDKQPLFAGYLGLSGDSVAIEVVRRTNKMHGASL